MFYVANSGAVYLTVVTDHCTHTLSPTARDDSIKDPSCLTLATLSLWPPPASCVPIPSSFSPPAALGCSVLRAFAHPLQGMLLSKTHGLLSAHILQTSVSLWVLHSPTLLTPPTVLELAKHQTLHNQEIGNQESRFLPVICFIPCFPSQAQSSV